MRILLALLALTACHFPFGGRSWSRPFSGKPLLAVDGRVYVHYLRFRDDARPSHFHAEVPYYKDAKRQHAGVVAIDLASGTCTLQGSGPRSTQPLFAGAELLAAERTTASGAHVARVRDAVTIGRGDRMRTIPIDPAKATRFIPESDAIVIGDRLVDVAGREIFNGVTTVARFGDRLFVPTWFDGVLELTPSPIKRVGHHVPPSLAADDARLVTPRPWAIDEEVGFGRTQLVMRGDALVLDAFPNDIFVASTIVPVNIYEDRYAVVPGAIIDVDGRNGVKKREFPGVKRMLMTRSGGMVIESTDDQFYFVSADLETVEPLHVKLHALGVIGNELVFHTDDRDSIFVFDMSARTWRELAFTSCVPRK